MITQILEKFFKDEYFYLIKFFNFQRAVVEIKKRQSIFLNEITHIL